MNKRLKQCPVCNSNLEIVEYHCTSCDTRISGRFGVSDFAAMNAGQQEFVKVFICCQGNIKEVEKILKISYPTVKKNLAEVVSILCPQKKQEIPKHNSEEILSDIADGKLSVEDAIARLKEKR